MDLRRYDERCVRITTRWGEVFEGVCVYNSEEYDEHEFGRAEESLQMESFLFFRSDIKRIRSLEKHRGPWGRFDDPYGLLETLTVEDGPDSIRDGLSSEDPEFVLRLLRCLDTYLDPASGRDLPGRDEVLDALRELARLPGDGAVRAAAERLIGRWG